MIYVICDTQTGYAKIGISGDPIHRLGQINAEYEVIGRMVCQFATKDDKKAEKRLHDRFKYRRIHGDGWGREWFDLSDYGWVQLARGCARFLHTHGLLEAAYYGHNIEDYGPRVSRFAYLSKGNRVPLRRS